MLPLTASKKKNPIIPFCVKFNRSSSVNVDAFTQMHWHWRVAQDSEPLSLSLPPPHFPPPPALNLCPCVTFNSELALPQGYMS